MQRNFVFFYFWLASLVLGADAPKIRDPSLNLGVGTPNIRDPCLNLGVGTPNIGDPSPNNYSVIILAQNYLGTTLTTGHTSF